MKWCLFHIYKKIVDMEENNAEKVFEVNNLQAIRDFVDVRDAVRAYEILLTHGKPGEIYDIASGENRSLAEIINHFNSFTKVEFKVKTKTNKTIEEEHIEIDLFKINNLGWQPIMSFKTSILDILIFYRKNK